jgi:hypothetical protein
MPGMMAESDKLESAVVPRLFGDADGIPSRKFNVDSIRITECGFGLLNESFIPGDHWGPGELPMKAKSTG